MKLLRSLVLATVVALGLAPSAFAQITVPNTFTTRQVISSSKMNGNFDEIELKALNRTAPILQATLDLDVSATYDLGTSAHKFRDIFLSRNATIGGTLGLTGDFAINTNKFTVTAASGNTLVAGTLDATGNFNVNTNKFSVVAASGNTTVAGTLGVTGLATLSGAATVTGTVTATTFSGSGASLTAVPVSVLTGTTLPLEWSRRP
jgi:hypothetical protein